MISIQVDDPYSQVIDQAELEHAAAEVLAHTQSDDQAGITIVIGGDAQIQELNRQFMDHDHPTDVLSFPSGEVDPDDGQVYLGDIIISFPQALRQAKEGGHPVRAELNLLVVHGVLHLLGFDHAESQDRESMWKAQAEILRKLDNRITGPAKEA